MKKLTLFDRDFIQISLDSNLSIPYIAKHLNKNKTTIYREIAKFRKLSIGKSFFTTKSHIVDCSLLNKPFSTCNSCPRLNSCNKNKYIYDSKYANFNSNNTKINSRCKLKTDRFIIDNIYLELKHAFKLNQPFSHILNTYEFVSKVSESTIRRWINNSVLNVKFDKRKYKKKNTNKLKIDIVYKSDLLKGRKFIDFKNFIANNSNLGIVEMDLIQGAMGTGYILTFFLRNCKFLFAFKIKDKTPQSIIRVLDFIELSIGLKMFKKLFGVILTDRGSEFLNFNEIIKSKKGITRTRIFYCDKASPTQKPYIENIHTLLRKFYPKGYDFRKISQNELDFVLSNINSLLKTSLNKESPITVFKRLYNEKTLLALNIKEIDAKSVKFML